MIISARCDSQILIPNFSESIPFAQTNCVKPGEALSKATSATAVAQSNILISDSISLIKQAARSLNPSVPKFGTIPSNLSISSFRFDSIAVAR